MRYAPLALVLLFAALAGCTNNAGYGNAEQCYAQGTTISCNAAGSGSQSLSFQCDGGATIDLSANVGGGSLSAKVTDGAGTSIYSKSVSSASQTSESKGLTGVPGTWHLSADRSGSFAGQFNLNVDGC